MTPRERIVELLRKMRNQTVDRGCTPAEAAAFSAKAAEWIEKYQIEEAELRAEKGDDASEQWEFCENLLRTGKKVFNPGMTQIVNALSIGMCCKCILLYKEDHEAVYGIVGESMDADYVCQLATVVVTSLQIMARLEGIEHGHEKASLVRWTNQYLTGAAIEILNRLNAERKGRAEARIAASSTALVITGETMAIEKRKTTEEVFQNMYPHAKTRRASSSSYDHVADRCGREAGKRVGLHVGIETK